MSIIQFVEENEIDILVLLESPFNTSQQSLLTALQKQNINWKYQSHLICEKVQLFYNSEKVQSISTFSEEKRVAAHKVNYENKSITLINLHFPDKISYSDSDQNQLSNEYRIFIEECEKQMGHSNTIVCGDFNMNPYQSGMVSALGFHAIASQKIAKSIYRKVNGKDYKYFYNPMWSFFGDLSKGKVAGSIYEKSSTPIKYFWHIFDQVIVRPDLVDRFDDNYLNIITSIQTTNLLTSKGIINSRYSDHLPIRFKIS